MLASFLTTICFAFSVVFAARSARVLGGAVANLARMSIALLLLGAWAHLGGEGLRGDGRNWYLASGVVGFGIGDVALFLALTRIGPRLSILLVQCLAAPIGALVERVWLGTTLRWEELACGAVILLGVALALAPSHGFTGSRRVFRLGVLWGVVAAVGQALGAVVSRKAYAVSLAGGVEIDGGTAAYQRLIGGLAFAAAFYFLLKTFDRSGEKTSPDWKRGTPLMLANALAGPVLGVACYQWALATTPTGLVLPIVATTPVLTMPLAFWLDGDRPTRRAILGAVIAVAGTAFLALV